MPYEKNHSAAEQVEAQYEKLLSLEPKLIGSYVPSNAAEQKQAFLRGEVRNPDHRYEKLEGIDFEQRARQIQEVGDELIGHAHPKHAATYEQFTATYLARTRFMQLAHEYKTATDQGEKERLAEAYMTLNEELYGEPDEQTYRSLLQEKLAGFGQMDLTGEAAGIRQELFEMTGFSGAAEKVERFAPSPETVEWVQGITQTLYGGMLAHVSDSQEWFNVEDVRRIFAEVLKEEFGPAADGWSVTIESAKSITVKAAEKRIVIPEDRGTLDRQTLRGLVVHEIGVHVLSAIMGGETDLGPLANGLAGYYDAEEGKGMVMQHALEGTFKEAGINHYVTTGLAYHDGKDFRDIFEVKWRMAALAKADKYGNVSSDDIEKAQNTAYGATMRIMRGTDELPWFKDLAYYNGTMEMWRHLEAIRGDDTKFIFVLMGKTNPADITHERIVYETATK